MVIHWQYSVSAGNRRVDVNGFNILRRRASLFQLSALIYGKVAPAAESPSLPLSPDVHAAW